MDHPRVAAIVPLRHDSERVPGKNYRLFAGRPLYHWIIRTLYAAETVAEVVIDTDSPFIREDAGRVFERVSILERPSHLRGGDVPMNDVLLNSVSSLEADLFLQTHSTNPLLRAETVDRAVRTFWDRRGECDSLFSVTRLHTRLWDASGHPLNHDPSVLLRTQDLPPVFEENSCLYLFERETLLRRGNRIGWRPHLLEIPPEEAVDIDEETDFRIAEALFKDREVRGGRSQ
ncbi:MAG: acylneuraminate cytidylyltransferase family protein [Proteobacteria bacterium]|nr:acylneuraminate cytidylyltransferase family protein [Pseudomonadota bacterium]